MGKPGVAYLLAHGWHSLSDLVVRAHTVYANLQQSYDRIEKSSLYIKLDPTEKGGISYFMGMLAAKVIGARLLDVPWLFHLSLLSATGGVATLKGKSEPDLVGLRRARDWVVAEAKGRTRGYSASAMLSAKLQTRQLRRINGSFPSLRVAIEACFSPSFHWALEDPEEFDDDAPDLDFDVDTALAMYYSAVVAATEQPSGVRRIQGREFVLREIPEVGVTVALSRDVRDRVLSRSLAKGDDSNAPSSAEPKPDGEFVVFADDVAIASTTAGLNSA
jgi:hypothetical protein